MAQQVLIQSAGLHTFKNYLSSNPPGSLEEALNVVIDRDNIIEPRRGFFKYGNNFGISTDRTKQLFSYKNRILRHFNSTLQYDLDGLGDFQNFSGQYDEISDGTRIKSIEANGNFYFTTAEGVKKLSVLNSSQFQGTVIIDAGGPKALDCQVTPNYTQEGFLLPLSKVAYRVVWGYKDANNNLILGSPSQRAVVQNLDSLSSCITDIEFAIPQDVNSTTFFYQVYRTAVIQANPLTLDALSLVDPGDEQYLVIEDFVTTTDITNGFVNITDITPDDFRAGGALLYTNPVSGDGIEQANEKPPFARDICLFKGYTFYANTKTRHRLNLSLLSVLDLISETSSITVTDGETSNTYTFRGFIETFTVDFTGMAFPGGKAALDGKYFTLISANDERTYKIWFDNTGTTVEPTLAGTISIKVDITAAADTATAVASATLNAINLSTNDFNITNNLGVLTVENSNNGFVTITATENIGAGFTISQDGLGRGEDASLGFIFLPRNPGPGENGPSVAQQVDQAAQSIVKVINANLNDIIYAYYLSSFNDVPGQMFFESKSTVGARFYIAANSLATAEEFNPTLSVQKSASVATGTNTVTVTSAAHGLSNGTQIVVYNSTTTPSLEGLFTISNVTLNTFDISATVTVSGNINYTLPTVQSDNEITPNRIYYSKFQQPEAVPLVNFIDIGPKDKEIQRIIPLREAVYVFKEEGIYRLTGEIAPFVVTPFDNSVSMTAPDTGVVLNNQVYCLSTQGVISVNDGGVSVISRPIEDKLLQISRPQYAFKTVSFGVSYESDRAFHLWTVTDPSDTVATQCYRFNSFTQTWTRWDKTATCGIVNFSDDKMYLGAGDGNFIDIERKNLDRTDKCDREFTFSIINDGVNQAILDISNVGEAEEGDLIRQTQYLSIAEFNRLLKRLDLDPGVTFNDYYSTLQVTSGSNLRNAVNALANKLDLDPGVNDTTFFSSLNGGITFPIIQSDFNIIINKLNLDSGVFFTDYDESTTTKRYEAIVLNVNNTQNQITVNTVLPFVEGEITLFKHIQTEVVWTYNALGDPSIFKQVSEGTFIFEDNNFTEVTIGYSSDLSPSFQEVNFKGYGNGDWGQFNWGNQFWGGLSSAKPIRTYIPRQKQRCRYMGINFKHNRAQENFSIYGVSLTFRPYSNRAYNKG